MSIQMLVCIITSPTGGGLAMYCITLVCLCVHACVRAECLFFTVITYLCHTHHNGSDICFVMLEGYMPIVPGPDI